MPSKPSGEIKTYTIKKKLSNGDVYVYERQVQYDPLTKRNRQIGSKLLGKKVQGQGEIVPTRPKRRSGSTSSVTATRRRVGMMEILDHVGKASGIDALLYANTDRGTARKIISLARYLVATEGGPLPSVVTFQYTHPLPYEEGLSEDIYHDLFVQVGRDASLEQSFFAGRCQQLGTHPALAYDSTTISTYSEQQMEAQHMKGKSNDGLKKIKFLVLYEAETRQPLLFRKLKGNISDMVTITAALKQLQIFGVRGAELITDSGYNSQENIANMLLGNFRFVTPIETSQTWVANAIDEHLDLNDDPNAAMPFDPAVHGVSVPMMHTFVRRRQYGSTAKGKQKGDSENVRRRVYLQIYFDGYRKAEQDLALEERIHAVQELLEAGTPLQTLSQKMQSVASNYLIIRRRGGKVTVKCDLEAVREKKKYNGFFALLTNKRKDSADCLQLYRKRALIELFFEDYKSRTNGSRPRVWTADALQGRMFVQFVALCYREFFAEQVRTMIRELGQPTGDPKHDLKKVLDDEKKLQTWLRNNSLRVILEWFDTTECTEVSVQLRKKRLRSEVTARDRLFLSKLGIPQS